MLGNLLNKFFDIFWFKRVLFILRIIFFENIKNKLVVVLEMGLILI